MVALLPGSRKHVVEHLAGDQLQIAERIREAIPGARFVVSVANDQVRSIVESSLRSSNVKARMIESPIASWIDSVDLVLAASGTTTLEVALHARPMIVMYNASRLAYQLVGRWMIQTKFLSLPNILAGRKIVPEFMPYYTSTGPIADRAIELLQSDEARTTMVRELAKTVLPLRDTHAAQRTAELLLDMISRRPR